MIIQALKEYYDRKAADPESQMAPEGWEWKEIPYLIVLDPEGRPLDISCSIEGQGKAKRAKRFLLPKSVKRTVGVLPNLLWDNPEYVTGYCGPDSKPDRVKTQHQAFQQRIENLGLSEDTGIKAVLGFLANTEKVTLLSRFDCWPNLLEEGANVSFQLAGHSSPVFSQESVRAAVQLASNTGTEQKIRCMVSGGLEPIALLHPAIKGVWGAQTAGANIVSFNADAFCSHGKEQGSNAQIGQRAAFAYTEALNHLLRKGSTQRIQVGDASTVFWSQKASSFEAEFIDLFGDPGKDDPDRNTRAVESLLRSVQSGALPADELESRFYVLGLAPNASRISIRFWYAGAIREMRDRLCQHFDDLRMVHGPKEKDAFSLFRLLVCTALQGKSENISPHLAGETMHAILTGGDYPGTLLQAVLRRLKAEREVTHVRAAILKACLNRSIRRNNPHNHQVILMSLDLENSNPGYRLGRLFATLEKIQSEANPGINATIRDRFYGAASSTPVTVFGNLMRLKNHHLAKLPSTGRRIYFERVIGEIMGGVSDFPANLNLADQGRFAIGYYHQTQDFFTKKEIQA